MKDIARLYKTLADETRLRILALLLEEGELCVCDIIAALQLHQPTVSRHLAHLRKAELVDDRRCGLWIYYSLREDDRRYRDALSLLKKQLHDNELLLDDRRRLAGFRDNNRCA